MDPLALAGRHAKWVLVLGLVAAIALPGVAKFLAGWLVPLIVAVMALGAMRLRTGETQSLVQRPLRSLGQTCALQLLVPLGVAGVLMVLGGWGSVWATALVLVLAAPAIMSSPNVAAIMDLDPATAMRLVVWGTLLVPLTSTPVLLLLYGSANLGAVLLSSATLALIILGAGGAGVALRAPVTRMLGTQASQRLDGASAILLAVFVMALMPELRTTFASDPRAMMGWMGLAFGLNFGLQILVHLIWRLPLGRGPAGSTALAAGNRNMALFFAALPEAQTAPLLAFLAAYQFPMYLTPLCLGWLYRR